MKKNNIKMLVAFHKPDKVYRDDIYTPIHVGRAVSKFKNEMTDMIGDDTGNNISEKNPMYCELTALYWAWKNLIDVDYIGLSHYRRYFDFHHQVPQYLPHFFMPCDKFDEFHFNLSTNVINELKKGKVILPKKQVQRESLITQYCLNHISDDMRTLKKVIHQYPDSKYAKAFDKIMFGNKYSPYNMFIMPKIIFDNYCQWLFQILFEVEAKTDTSHYNPIQKRIYGYMSERLLNVYISANKLEEVNLPVVTFNDSPAFQNPSCTEFYFKNLVKKMAFKVTLPPFFEE